MRVITGLIYRNKEFFNSLDKSTRITLLILLVTQFIVYLKFLLVAPLHYDEWQSLRTFSGVSFQNTWSCYPVPNNHVFYNLVSRLFILTDIEMEISVRMPSLFVSIIASYYFFKLCKSQFGNMLSLALLAYVIGLYTFIDYSFLARGYSFLNLFCILMMYSAWKLSENYSSIRYRGLFIISQSLGMFTVPTFLYAIGPIYVVLVAFVLKRKRRDWMFLILKDCLTSIILVIIAYFSILFGKDSHNLLHPNNATDNFSFSEPDGFNKLAEYLQKLFSDLFNSKYSIIISLLIIGVFLYNWQKGRLNFVFILSVFMFFSPILILSIHHVFAFLRNWAYLVFPATICFGTIIHLAVLPGSRLFKLIFFKNIRTIFCVLLISVTLFRLGTFEAERRVLYRWDYELNFFRKNHLSPVAAHVREVGKTETGLGFYVADEIVFFVEGLYPGRWVKNNPINENIRQDVLVIYENDLNNYRRHLIYYDFSYKLDRFLIFIKKKEHFKKAS